MHGDVVGGAIGAIGVARRSPTFKNKRSVRNRRSVQYM